MIPPLLAQPLDQGLTFRNRLLHRQSGKLRRPSSRDLVHKGPRFLHRAALNPNSFMQSTQKGSQALQASPLRHSRGFSTGRPQGWTTAAKEPRAGSHDHQSHAKRSRSGHERTPGHASRTVPKEQQAGPTAAPTETGLPQKKEATASLQSAKVTSSGLSRWHVGLKTKWPTRSKTKEPVNHKHLRSLRRGSRKQATNAA